LISIESRVTVLLVSLKYAWIRTGKLFNGNQIMTVTSRNLSIGRVALNVSNLEKSIDFYKDALGMSILEIEGDTAYLGTGANHLLVLRREPDSVQSTGKTGLYHFAILVPNRLELAKSLDHLIQTKTPIQGFADHQVSEAIYLADPDNNGIEIYRDYPRKLWPFIGDKLRMGIKPLDTHGLLSELNGHKEEWPGLSGQTKIGHMHLKVSDIPSAEAFYCDILGFDLIQRYGSSASFVSSGGYHHHIAFNTWSSLGASPPPPHSIGMQYFQIILSNDKELDRIIGRLKDVGLPLEKSKEGWMASDPSMNQILLTASQIE
jgi:catechol 2,3-dioxygenase